MIRVRTGQRWKREAAGRPQDSLALELHGVDLLAGAADEPLATVVPELVAAVSSLMGGARAAQLSLPDSHLELCLWRSASEVELSVVTLSRPARRLRPPVRVDLLDLKDAVVGCARTLEADLRARAPRLARGTEVRAMLKQLARLAKLEVAQPVKPLEATVSGGRHEDADVAMAFALEDPEGRLHAYTAKTGGALTTLLCAGATRLEVGGKTAWSSEDPPFLVALELSRLAEDLAHAVESADRRFALQLPGAKRPLSVDLARGTAQLGEVPVGLGPDALARLLLEHCVALSVRVAATHRAQARNPFVDELTSRCRRALGQVRGPSAAQDVPGKAPRRRKQPEAPPLHRGSKLKRLRFEPLWTQAKLGGEEPGTLLLGAEGPVFQAPELTAGFDAGGKALFRHASPHGVAASREGLALCAEAERVLLFARGSGSARWVRDHDGAPVGPRLFPAHGLLVTASEQRGALAFSETTGRELWRFFPPRTQRASLHVQGQRAVLTTDAGIIFGLDVQDGQLRYRVRAGVPFLGPAVAWGRKLVAALGKRDRLGLIRFDGHGGKVDWTVELPFSKPSAPLPVGNRLFIAGEHEESAALACVSAAGELVWRRVLHLGGAPFQLQVVDGGVLASAQTGAATLLDADGQVRWHLGAAGAGIACPIRPCVTRNVLLLPGAQVRAVSPQSGEVLGEVEGGPGLCDLAVDRRLNLFLLDELGDLRAFRLRTHLGVVASGEAGA